MIKVLEVADRMGWAIDRLAKPIAELKENVDIAYFHYKPERFLASGYSDKNKVVPFNFEMAKKYDVLHFHHWNCAKEIIKRIDKKVKKVISIHTERDVTDVIDDWSIYDTIICPTKKCAENFSKVHNNTKVVHHCIDLNKYTYQWKYPLENTVGYVGRVVKHKRFGLLKRECFKAGLKLMGTGYIEDLDEFKKYPEIERDRHFKYTILLPERQMPDFYARIQIFVCLSEQNVETGPLPVLEAMACGVPVISTKVGWAKDVCKHNSNIIFIEDEQIDYLADIMKKLIKNVELMNNLRANALRLMEDYSLENYANQLMEIYES